MKTPPSLRRFAASGLFLLAGLTGPATAFGATLEAATSTNNNLGDNSAVYFNLTAIGANVTVTSLTTFSMASANATFTLSIFTYPGTVLAGGQSTGPTTSITGWTSLGSATATQGTTSEGLSLPVDTPDIFIGAGETLGVALLYSGAGPRYFGTASPPLSTFSDGTLEMLTGASRTVPFSISPSYFASRAFAGSLTYTATPVPEPSTYAILGGCLALGATLVRRRQRQAHLADVTLA